MPALPSRASGEMLPAPPSTTKMPAATGPWTRALAALRQPVHPENRAHLDQLWDQHTPELRLPWQLVGRQWEGCAATIGAMPRCDFGCTACYLGPEANRVPAASLEEVVQQLDSIRRHVGRRGNVQLTDGELTLRPASEVAELVRAAKRLELIPMLMTHGEILRQDPSYLDELMEAGLEELSFHVDTTQRGRGAWDRATREEELHPLREEFAALVREARRRTGRPLRVASTVTVTPENLDGVETIARWYLEHTDVFRILSFQPVAEVGRTRDRKGVTRAALWERIAAGLGESEGDPRGVLASELVFGHPDCTQVVMGSVYAASGESPRYVPLRDPLDAANERDLERFFERFGGLSFRDDGRLEALGRALGVALRAPDLVALHAPRWLTRNLARLEPGRPARALARLATGRARVTPLAIVSHHFMDAEELESPRGAEREAACVFRVPIAGADGAGTEMVSMCRVNAGDVRKRIYAELRGAEPVATAERSQSADPGVPGSRAAKATGPQPVLRHRDS